MRKSVFRLILILSALVLTLSACGGGGGGGGNGAKAPKPTALQAIEAVNDGLGHTKPKAVYNDAGEGLAVWFAYDGHGGNGDGEVFYSFYNGSSWSLEAKLSSGHASQLSVATDGTGFAVAWYDVPSNSIHARVYNGAAWGADTRLDTPGTTADYPVLTSDGTGYMAAWRKGSSTTNVEASLFNGAGWETPVVLDDPAYSASAHAATLASNGTDYMAIWVQDDGTTGSTIFGALYNGSAWEKAEKAEGMTATNSAPAIATDGSTYMAAWKSGSTDIYAALYNGSAWETEAAIDSSSTNTFSPRIISNGTSYMAAWHQFQSGGPVYGIIATEYKGSSWSAAAPIEALSISCELPVLATDGSTYTASWITGAYGNGPYDIYSASFNGAWNTEALAEDLGGNSSEPFLVYNGAGYSVFFQNHNGAQYMVYEASLGSAPARLPSTGGVSTATDVRIAMNEAGQTLAVISQYYGSTHTLYARLNSGGAWGAPVYIGTAVTSTDAIAVTSNGTGFAVAWVDHNNYGTSNYDVYAKTFDGSAWSAASRISTETDLADSVALASDGTGYMAAWQQSDGAFYNIYASLNNGTSWGAVDVLDTLDSQAQAPALASDGSTYMAVWYQSDSGGDDDIRTALYNGSAWESEVIVDSSVSTNNRPSVASDGKTYMAVWKQFDGSDDSSYSALYNGSGWDAAEPIESLSVSSTDNVKVASDGNTYMAVWTQYNGGSVTNDSIYANIYSGGAWGTEAPVAAFTGSDYADYAQIAVGGGYLVSYSFYDDSTMEYNGVAVRQSGTAWGAPVTLDSGTGDVNDVWLAGNGKGVAAAWLQTNDENTFQNAFSVVGF